MQIPSSAPQVVVIGGGMAGLVATAVLAKNRIPVELFEHHRLPGGCCTSFKRKGFTFDAAVHAIGGCHPGGMFRTVFEELDIWERITMVRADPMDVVCSPFYTVPIWADQERFIEALGQAFPHEIDRCARLVRFLDTFGPQDFARWARCTYREVLDHFLTDDVAKTVFMLPLGNIGMPSSRVGAITACTLFRENQLHGGYAPRGGFQALPDALVERIRELGGRVSLKTAVERIELKDGRAVAVHTNHGRRVACDYIVGAAAVPHLFFDLIGRQHLPAEFIASIEKAEYSFSGGMVFIGIDGDLRDRLAHHGCHWYLNDARLDQVDGMLEAGWIEEHLYDHQGPFYFALPSRYDPSLAPPGKTSLVQIIPSVYKPREYWRTHKERLGDAGVARLEQLLPGISNHIVHREVATSATIERYTRNTRGAWYGWAMIPSQSNMNRMARLGPIANLQLAGHWTRPGPGVVQVVKSGQMTAKALLREIRKSSKNTTS